MMLPRRTILTGTILLAPMVAIACVLPDRKLGEFADDSSGGDGTAGEETSTAGHDGGTATSAGGSTGDDDGSIPTECVSADVVPIHCGEDADHDSIRLACDNEPDYFNPDQRDIDDDGVADVVDLCPTVESSMSNSADSDRDGIGNECDSCRQTVNQYNDAEGVSVDARMLVRNIPSQIDSDEDGIGDVCDNCITVANCEDFGPDNPFEVGDPIAYDDPTKCQRDDDLNLVGDVCLRMQAAGAAGPVGVGSADDFDQDGITNALDVCPRQPVDRIPCTTDVNCGQGRTCDTSVGLCNHLDSDADLVGDICDTCPYAQNPEQFGDGGMQEDDPDGDFVGTVCESHSDCAVARSDARPFAFFDVSVNGDCCTVALVEDPVTGDLLRTESGAPLLDPDGLPIRVACNEGNDPALRVCRRLPDAVAARPGVLAVPPGCAAALVAAGHATAADNPRLGPGDVASLDALWNHMCLLPQFDQDLDGIGDQCDLCHLDFDPDNTPYIDDQGRLWPTDGKYCNGEYSIYRCAE